MRKPEKIIFATGNKDKLREIREILEGIDIPETVTKIDDLAFNGCQSMTKVELHEGLKKIGKKVKKES